MRLFVGIDIPEDVKAKLRAALARLRPLADFRWSPIENLHVTTKFIGEWPEEKLEEMKAALAEVNSPTAVDIAIRGLGWFPNPHRPRVFWAGVHAGEELRALTIATDEAVARLGVPAETREFRPHLTLARIKDGVGLESVRRGVAALDSQDFGTFHALGFVLYLSTQGKYTKLAEFPLPNL
jgi:RNA 2',3'-cyclic 3'-phosphodiesterase